MGVEPVSVEVDGRAVTLFERPGMPLLLTQRMAARDMNLWVRVWPLLARDFTVASFDLPVPAPEAHADPRALFRRLGDACVRVAEGLGHERFHYLGWTGGATLGLHLLVDQPERLQSMILFGALYPGGERRHLERHLQTLSTLLREGLEAYTWWWLGTSFSPGFLEAHYDEVAAMVARRLEADAGRQLDAERVVSWLRVLFDPQVGAAELAAVDVPTLVVATPGDIGNARRLCRAIPTADLAVVPGPAFAPYEMPDAFMAALGPFIRSVRRGASGPATRLARPSGPATRVVEGQKGGDAVVVLHGWLMAPGDWTPCLDALAADGVRAVALAQPAHAGSEAPPAGFTMADWVERTFAVLDDLGIERAVLVGHSMGGMLALAMAAARPERVSGLGLVATTDEAWDDETRDGYHRAVAAVALGWSTEVAAQLAPVLIGKRHLEQQPAFLGRWTNEVATYDLPGMVALGEAVAGRPDLTAVTPALLVPAVVLHGDDDQAVEPGAGRRLADRLPAAEYIELEGAGHCLPLERAAETTAALRRLVHSTMRVTTNPRRVTTPATAESPPEAGVNS